MNRSIEIYLVSLDSDYERRAVLKERFSRYYNDFKHISAVDGRTISSLKYYKAILPEYLESKKMLSPAEIGCTQSHIQVLKTFIASGKEKALILEDDIIGCDSDIDDVINKSDFMPEDSVYIPGGQNALDVNKFLLGKEYKTKGLFVLAKYSHHYILRTCCYVVTKSSAKLLLEFYKKRFCIADNWEKFFLGTKFEILYSNTLRHPIDLTNSHIEIYRSHHKALGIKDKLLSKDVIFKIFRLISRYFKLYLLLLSGNKRLYIEG